MAEKAELSADETDRIRDQVQSCRSQDFISDAAVIAIANHKASRASEKRALAVRRTCLQSNWHRDSATNKPAGQSEIISQSELNSLIHFRSNRPGHQRQLPIVGSTG
jgi:hypothetical protein